MSANRQVHSTTHVFQVWRWIYHDWILSRFLCGHLYTFERNWTGNIFLFRVLWTSNILFLDWFYFYMLCFLNLMFSGQVKKMFLLILILELLWF